MLPMLGNEQVRQIEITLVRLTHSVPIYRWQNCGRWFTSLEQLAGHVARLHAAPGPRGLFYCGWEGCARGERGFNAR